MRNEGLGSWPARRARKTPHRTALIHHDTTSIHQDTALIEHGTALTYEGLYERTTRLAHALRARGVRRGDRIAYLGPNHPSYLETLFAAGTLGAVFVPLNTRLAGPEIAYQLIDSGAKALVYGAAFEGLVAGLPGNCDVRTYVEVGAEYDQLLASASGEAIDEPVMADDTCVIMYTSGTTGRPKGAMLTHGNLTWNAVNVLVDQDLIADERALVSAPLFHTAGLNMLTLPVLLKGVPASSSRPSTRRPRSTWSNGTGSPSCSACPPCSNRWPASRAGPRPTCPRCGCSAAGAHPYRPRSSPPTRSGASPSSRATA